MFYRLSNFTIDGKHKQVVVFYMVAKLCRFNHGSSCVERCSLKYRCFIENFVSFLIPRRMPAERNFLLNEKNDRNYSGIIPVSAPRQLENAAEK